MLHSALTPRRWLVSMTTIAALAMVFVPLREARTSAVGQGASLKRALTGQAGRSAEVSSLLLESQREPSLADRPRFMPGYVVVKFAPSLSRRAMQVIAGEAGGTSVERPPYADFHYVKIPADADPVEAAAVIARDPDVIYAEADAAVYPLAAPNDPYYKLQWNLQKLQIEQAWQVNNGGSPSIIVAVLDTGVAYADKGAFARAPDFDANTFVPGYDFVWDDAEPFDTDGHGTHVTGIIAEAANNGVGVAGMAPSVRIMPVKVLYTDWDDTGNPPYPFGSSTVSRGIHFAVDNGARVINMSLGSLSPNSATLDALRYAVSRKVFVAISAGNEGNKGNAPTYPASYAKELDGVMAVAAVGYNFTRAPYSSFLDYVEVAAPGGDTRSDLNNDGYGDGILAITYNSVFADKGIFNTFDYTFYQGTSMAAPHVTALAAMLMDQGVTSPQAIEAAIKRFTTNKPAAGRSDELGAGVIDPRGTLRGLGLAR